MTTEESLDTILWGFRSQLKKPPGPFPIKSSRKTLSVFWRAAMQTASASRDITCSSDEPRKKEAGTCWYETNKRTEPISIKRHLHDTPINNTSHNKVTQISKILKPLIKIKRNNNYISNLSRVFKILHVSFCSGPEQHEFKVPYLLQNYLSKCHWKNVLRHSAWQNIFLERPFQSDCFLLNFLCWQKLL